jgi:polysaccharide biosynthesis protein PslG
MLARLLRPSAAAFRPSVAAALGACALACTAPAGAAGAAGRAGSAAATPAPPLGGVNVEGMGPHAPPAEAERDISLARALHAKALRIELPWAVLEPTGPGALNPAVLPFLDRLFGEAAADGIKVIAFVDITPCWASSAPEDLRHGCGPGGGQSFRWPPANPADYAAVMRRLAERYGNSIGALEVWNEPDQANEKYFAGPEKPERYAALLKAAYTAVKQVSPGIPVLAGSLVGVQGGFLKALYADGIKGYYDGIAVHFYTLTLAAIRAYRALQLSNGDTTPLWLDEFGWPSCYPQRKLDEEQACVTPAVQASNIRSLFHALSSTGYVAAMTIYDLHDERVDKFGLLSVNGARKPSFRALASVLASPFGPQSPVTLSLRRIGGHVVARGSGPVGDYMQLEAVKGRLRFKASFTLDRFNQYQLALPRVLGTRGVRVLVYQEWGGVGKGVQRRI